MNKICTFIIAIAFATNAAALTPPPEQPKEALKPAPNFTVKDIEGKTQSISQYKGKIIVLEWNNPECPFVKKFYDVKEMQKLQAQAKTNDVVWLTINSGAAGKQGHLSTAEAKDNFAAKESKAQAYILDADGKIGKAYGAASTPTMVVIDKEGNIAYQGAIDDNASSKSEDIAMSKNYVSAAIDSLKIGKTPDITSTKAYGCAVKYAE